MTHAAPGDAAPGGDASAEPAGPADAAATTEAPLEFGPCMPADAVLAWARGSGAEVVVEALARYLTDLTPATQPEVPADRVAGWIRSMQAAPFADPTCASLLVSFWFDPQTYLTAAAGTGPAETLALFSPALTEPAVAYAFCTNGRETCRTLRLEDLDGDGADELLLERTVVGTNLPSVQTMYEFPADADPLPVWISDDDAVRRALFGAGGDADPTNQEVVGEAAFSTEDGVARVTVDYGLVACPRGTGADGQPPPCEPSGTQTMSFTRLGDVYLLPDEPEPGAPWGWPEGEGNEPSDAGPDGTTSVVDAG